MSPAPELPDWPHGRTGYVAIVGRPNVGKSTFLNQALGCHLAAVSPKPQTTRQRWRGILSDDSSQIIFVDTPGVHQQNTRLGDSMLRSVARSLADADVILCLCDPTRRPGDEDAMVVERVAAAAKPVILAANKADVATAEQAIEIVGFYRAALPLTVADFAVSALRNENLEPLLDELRGRLPEGPFFYPPDQVTDAFERDIVGEIIREAALQHLREEVPHALAVEVIQWQERDKRLRVDANLYVERASQRPVLLGAKGVRLKQIRTDAIALLREWRDQFIDLRLHVQVRKDWRDKPGILRELGFE